jgi:FkbM family methyltransferase
VSKLHVIMVRAVAAYLRGCQWEIARWRLVSYALRHIRIYGPQMVSATVSTHFGFTMTLDLRDWVDQHIFATGDYEAASAGTIAALLQPGDFCVDAGANVGFFSLLMATRVGAGGAVWAFEPAPATRARLAHNVRINGLTNVTIRSEALSNVDGEQRFWAGPTDHSGIASLRPLHGLEHSYDVRTARLTSCLPRDTVPRLIKMDVEGAEYLAILGMVDLLQASHPDILIEISDHFLKELGSSSREVCSTLIDLGYGMYVVGWNGLAKCTRWTPSLPTQFNALFTSRTSLPATLTLTRDWVPGDERSSP